MAIDPRKALVIMAQGLSHPISGWISILNFNPTRDQPTNILIKALNKVEAPLQRSDPFPHSMKPPKNISVVIQK